MTYGIKICTECCGYGIVLTSAEKIQFYRCLTTKKEFKIVERKSNEMRQCSVCRGKAWVFVANHKNTTLPVHVWRR